MRNEDSLSFPLRSRSSPPRHSSRNKHRKPSLTPNCPSLLTIYKDLHAHPELSTREERSAAIVAKELKAAGCEVTENVGKYPNPN